MGTKIENFKFKVDDLVYVRTTTGTVTDRIISISDGVVKLDRIKKDFYMNGRPVGSVRSAYRIVDIYRPKNPASCISDKWLTELKEDDDVIIALSNGKKTLTYVVRVTPAGKIKVKNNLEMFYPDGTSVHRGRLTAWLEPATDEAKQILKQQQDREKALHIILGCNFSVLPAEKLIKIHEIIIS